MSCIVTLLTVPVGHHMGDAPYDKRRCSPFFRTGLSVGPSSAAHRFSGKLSDEPNGLGGEDAGYYLKLTVQLSLQISVRG
jgi:hypothetical protein